MLFAFWEALNSSCFNPHAVSTGLSTLDSHHEIKNMPSLKLVLYLILSLACGLPAFALSPERIYLRLQQAIGDEERVWPELQLRTGASSVLAYNRQKNVIFIDELALKVCRSFGPAENDALAFLLAHEMTHFYQQHHWKEIGFGSSFLADHATYSQHIMDEKEADLFGAFVTHLAGYRSVSLIPEIFDRVYAAYGLAQDLANYPSLPERKQVANEVCRKVNELTHLFETANYLMAIGESLQAAATYEYIMQFVKFKSLYKNAGTALVAAAIRESGGQQARFVYPLEFDLDLPLRSGALAEREKLLQRAVALLSEATHKDTYDHGTFINLACAYELNGQAAAAKELLLALKPLAANAHQQAELEILRGIIAARENKRELAEEAFQQAVRISPEISIQEMASRNLQILHGQTSLPKPSTFHASRERIGGLDLQYQNELDFEGVTINNPYTMEEIHFGWYRKATAELTHISGYYRTIAFLMTDKPGLKTSHGFGLGTSFSPIKQHFPDGRIVHHHRGYFWMVPSEKLLFNFNHSDKIVFWGTYEIY